jgi:hypothetical protein
MFSECTCSGVSKISNLFKVRALSGQHVPQHDVGYELQVKNCKLRIANLVLDAIYLQLHWPTFSDKLYVFTRSSDYLVKNKV